MDFCHSLNADDNVAFRHSLNRISGATTEAPGLPGLITARMPWQRADDFHVVASVTPPLISARLVGSSRWTGRPTGGRAATSELNKVITCVPRLFIFYLSATWYLSMSVLAAWEREFRIAKRATKSEQWRLTQSTAEVVEARRGRTVLIILCVPAATSAVEISVPILPVLI